MPDPVPIVSDPHEQLLRKARTETQQFPRHEPSHWLRMTAEAAALRLAAMPGRWSPGTAPIIPLVPIWPPTADHPAHLCARCGSFSRTRTTGYRRCGFMALSEHHPGVLLKFAFELCEDCAVKEFGE